MPPAERWRVRSPPLRSAASSFERLPPPTPERWRALLGRKISIRYALTGDPENPFSEAIGVVSGLGESPQGQTVEVLTRTGALVAIPIRDVLAGKVFP